jgi:ketosteroid isomerase-like protein
MMNRIMVVVALASGAFACRLAVEDAAVSSDADLQAVREVRAQEVAAMNAGDTTLAYASADIVMMPPGEPAVVGIAAARGWVQAFAAQFSADLAYTTDDFVVSGDWAIEQYAGNVTLTPVGGGDAMRETVKGIHVYRRQADGSWKMTHDAWNFDAQPMAQ